MKKFAFCLLLFSIYACNPKEEEPQEPDPPTEWEVIDLNEHYKNQAKPQ